MTANTMEQSVGNQLVSSYYGYQVLKYIAIELRDNVDTTFSHEHLLAEIDLLGLSLENMMNEVIE